MNMGGDSREFLSYNQLSLIFLFLWGVLDPITTYLINHPGAVEVGLVSGFVLRQYGVLVMYLVKF
ncbi:hypothetical protein C9439_02560 [archaeon SCG-AAA382B04]|nr:hypothetical protein C9439_02560 [archaeon SCG-AAA382B04]